MKINKPSLEQRIAAIEYRNKAVSSDKAWETSNLRRVVIAGTTYLVVVTYLTVTGADNTWLSAVVPAIGYLISTLVIKSVRDWWMTKRG